MKLTKEQRHAVYELAFKYFKRHVHPNICGCVGSAAEDLYPKKFNPYRFTKYIKVEFPELSSKKPKYTQFDNYWWPLADRKIRTKIFKELIEETL